MFGNDPEVARHATRYWNSKIPGRYLSYKDFIIEKSVNAIVA
jgi:hypothetical protein